MKRASAVAVLVVFLTGCTAYKAQRAMPDPNTTRDEQSARQIEADPRAVSAFSSQPVAMKQAILLANLEAYVTELASSGKYDCCVKPGCRQCVLTAGECHCRVVIDANGPCCGECTQAWVEGRGDTAGVDREQVLAHLGCVRELYEKKVPEGVVAPGQKKDQ